MYEMMLCLVGVGIFETVTGLKPAIHVQATINHCVFNCNEGHILLQKQNEIHHCHKERNEIAIFATVLNK